MDPAMQEQLLQQLRDIHAPEAIGWWPLAIGWWILIVLALAGIIGVSVFFYLRYKQEAYRREALKIAAVYFREYELTQDIANYLEQINQLLRRVLIKLSRDQNVAEISGEAWISALNRHGREALSENSASALSTQLYRPHPEADVQQLHLELTRWLKTHRRNPDV